jgi:hypothetical protein
VSGSSPETAVLIARVRDEVTRLSAELQLALDAGGDVAATGSIRVDQELFVAAAGRVDSIAGALRNPVIGVADGVVVNDTPSTFLVPVPHAAVHAAVYRADGRARHVVTVECDVRPDSPLGSSMALPHRADPAQVWVGDGEDGHPAAAIDRAAARLAEADAGLTEASGEPVVVAIPGFGLAVAGTGDGDVVATTVAAVGRFSTEEHLPDPQH